MEDRDEGERMERGTRSQKGGEARREWNRVETAWEGGLYLNICAGVLRVPIVTLMLMRLVCLLIQGWFEKTTFRDRSCVQRLRHLHCFSEKNGPPKTR